MAEKKTKKIKCYHCNQAISEKELVEKRIPLTTVSGIRHYRRKFHMECLKDYLETMEVEYETKEENNEWERCYELYRDLLSIPKTRNLPRHAILRLLGLRLGRYIPNGQNVRGVKRGYDFTTIYYALAFSGGAIRKALAELNFKDDTHMINYTMKIVTENINTVALRLDAKKKVEEKVSAEIEVTEEERSRAYLARKSASDTVSHMFEEVVDNEDEDLEDLFQ